MQLEKIVRVAAGKAVVLRTIQKVKKQHLTNSMQIDRLEVPLKRQIEQWRKNIMLRPLVV